VASASSDDVSTQAETATPADVTATPAAARSGLDLLVDASSEVDTKPKEADGGEVPSTITGITNGEFESEMGASASSLEYDTTYEETKKQQCKTFPQILHEILSTPDYQTIARWLPEGSSFFITDKERFSDEILPKYFRVALFHSFVRKLHRWGFRRVKSRGKGKGDGSSFAHNNFVRDKPWLCLNMRCKSKPSYHKVPSAKKKKADNQHHANPETADSLANAARIVVHPKSPPSLLAAACGSRAFVPSCLPSTSTLPSATAAAAAAGSHTLATIANTTQERQILMLRMRQRHQLQV